MMAVKKREWKNGASKWSDDLQKKSWINMKPIEWKKIELGMRREPVSEVHGQTV